MSVWLSAVYLYLFQRSDALTFESALSFFIAVFIFGITPGPGVFAILSKALSNGARSCFFLALGMTISDMLYLIAACFGLAAIATNWGSLFLVVRLIGAAYLIFLGWKLWTAPITVDSDAAIKVTKSNIMSFVQGFLISASNPKVILFYIAFLPTFMDLTVLSFNDIALASLLTVFSLMLGLMLIAKSASAARRFFQSQKGVKTLNRTAGSIMVGAGAFLLLNN